MAPLTRRVIAAAPRLQLIGIGRGGPVNANLRAAAEHGVAVCCAPGRNANATAEHTLGLILAAARRIPQTHAELVAGRWRSDYYRYDAVGIELRGSTVGLIGGGAVGHRVAELLAAFGAHVLIHDPYLTESGVAELVSLDELLSRAQILTLHARVTPETTGMVGAPQIAAMPAGSIIVNCARGTLLDYDAVCDSIDAGHLFGAAFDVFPEEPIPAGSRLLSTPGIALTPHLAGASRQTAANAAALLAEDVAHYLRGEPLVHPAQA
jgi:D-3-phosphoglycerate dehydrogenase